MDDKKPPPQSNELRDALAELVACKQMREEISRRRQRRECSIARNPVEVRAVAELHNVWKIRDFRAWNGARAALSSAVPGDRDALRLDWLSSNPREGSIRLSDGTFKHTRAWAIAADERWTLREAIDAAMAGAERP